MPTPILSTKLYLPPLRPHVVSRPRLIERINEGLQRKLTLVSAPAGFGKTTLMSAWLAGSSRPTAWLSLDEKDNDPVRFLMYLIAALQAITATIGKGLLEVLQSPQPPPIEAILTALLNELLSLSDHCILVLDDYHVIDAKPVAHALTFLLDHLPPHLHLVIATREDPPLPLARLRVGSQLTEVRATDLRFTHTEAAAFLTQVMGLDLPPEDITALETRTEGWIAGLQLAALSLQGQENATSFITSFTGSHHFVMDYLVEEVLQQQSESIQTFLLRTSILDRMSGSLCDDVVLDPAAPGQATLEYLEHANLFLIPLDNERRWYRYHHLFADLLRQRLFQSAASSPEEVESSVNELHRRASAWYEEHGFPLDAFRHAAAAHDVEHAERLIAGKGIPRHFRGAVTMLLDWLGSLPETILNARPSLWVKYASLMVVNGQTTGVEEKLQAAEAALRGTELDDTTRDLIGQMASIRATLALTQYQVESMLAQSRRALEYLPPGDLSSRVTAYWVMGFAYTLQRDPAQAREAYTEALALSQVSGNTFGTILATIGLGQVQEADNQLAQAAQTYRRVLQLAGDQPLQILCEAHLGLARVLYAWNELEEAEQHGYQSLRLAQQYDQAVIDRFIVSQVFLARLQLARGDVAGAAALLAQASRSARQQHFVLRLPEIAAAQVLVQLHQGNLAAAAHLAQMHELPLSQARVSLARGEPSTALAVLESWRQQVETRDGQDERLKVMVLQAVALQACGEQDRAVQLLTDALAIAEPGGFIRLFVDEGSPMAQLLTRTADLGLMLDYIDKLLKAFEAEGQKHKHFSSPPPPAQPLIEPLSSRELEVLHLMAQGLSNQQISERLFLALDTVKGHNRKIFGKLQVQRRTEAVARAHQLGLI